MRCTAVRLDAFFLPTLAHLSIAKSLLTISAGMLASCSSATRFDLPPTSPTNTATIEVAVQGQSKIITPYNAVQGLLGGTFAGTFCFPLCIPPIDSSHGTAWDGLWGGIC